MMGAAPASETVSKKSKCVQETLLFETGMVVQGGADRVDLNSGLLILVLLFFWGVHLEMHRGYS